MALVCTAQSIRVFYVLDFCRHQVDMQALLHTELYLNARGLLTYTLTLTLVYSYDENLTAGLEEKGVCVWGGGA